MPNNQDPTQWEEDIRAFERQDDKKAPPSNPILFLGSSSIRFWRLKKYFPDHYQRCLNRGFGGSGIPDTLHYFERLVVPYTPGAIVFYSGENDLGHGASAERVLEDTRQFVARLQSRLPGCALLLLPIKPSPALWGKWPEMQVVNSTLCHLAQETAQVDTIDTATPMLGPDQTPRRELYMPDQLHMSTEGYTLWSHLVLPWVVSRA